MPARGAVLRRVAEHELEAVYPGLPPDRREELVTSVVRQWLTHDGHAGILGFYMNHWLTLDRAGGRLGVVREKVAGSLWVFLGPWHIGEDQLPDILRALNLGQTAVFTNKRGVRLRVRVEPRGKEVVVGEAPEDAPDGAGSLE